MDVLESQMEALIFNYLSFGFLTTVNTFWTLIAVTAAVSFWRIRAVGSLLSPPSPRKANDSPSFHRDLKFNGSDSSTQLQEAKEEEEEEETEEVEEEAEDEVCSCSNFGSAVINDGNVKRKLNVYYEDNGDVNSESVDDEEIVHVYGGYLELEGMLMTRKRIMEDFGWYRCQDLTSLSGSVVKLWDGGIGRRSSSALGGVGQMVVGVRV